MTCWSTRRQPMHAARCSASAPKLAPPRLQRHNWVFARSSRRCFHQCCCPRSRARKHTRRVHTSDVRGRHHETTDPNHLAFHLFQFTSRTCSSSVSEYPDRSSVFYVIEISGSLVTKLIDILKTRSKQRYHMYNSRCSLKFLVFPDSLSRVIYCIILLRNDCR